MPLRRKELVKIKTFLVNKKDMYYNYGQPMYPTQSEPARITPITESYTPPNGQFLTSPSNAVVDYFNTNKWWIISLVILFIIIIVGVIVWKYNKNRPVVDYDVEGF